MLFTIFDFVQGDDQAAAAHLRGGVAILRNFVARTGLLNRTITFRGQTNEPDNHSLDPESRIDYVHAISALEELRWNLLKAFAYLDFWSLIWSDGETLFPEVTLIDSLLTEPGVRDNEEFHFHLRCFEPLENRIHEFLRAAKARKYSTYDETLTTPFSSAKDDLVNRLCEWRRKLSALCVAEYENLDGDQKLRVHVAELNYQKIRVMLLASQEHGSIDYRPFDSAFRQIVSVSRRLINSTVYPTFRIQVFSFTPRLIHPLYITATRCCLVEVCEEAIELLESLNWSEGAWNSAVMAKISRRKLDDRIAHDHERNE